MINLRILKYEHITGQLPYVHILSDILIQQPWWGCCALHCLLLLQQLICPHSVPVVMCDINSSCMRVMNHSWSATKQHLHLQSAAEISCHSVLSGDRIWQCGTSSGSRHKDTDQCKSPFPSAGTAVSLTQLQQTQWTYDWSAISEVQYSCTFHVFPSIHSCVLISKISNIICIQITTELTMLSC